MCRTQPLETRFGSHGGEFSNYRLFRTWRLQPKLGLGFKLSKFFKLPIEAIFREHHYNLYRPVFTAISNLEFQRLRRNQMTKMIKIWATPHPFLQNQLNRRILVVLNIILLVLTSVFIFLNLQTISVAFLIILSLLAVILTISTRNISNSIEMATDERESRVRDHAHRISYWAMAGIAATITGGIFGYYAREISKSKTLTLILNQDSMFKIVCGAMIFYILFSVFPTWIVAWLEPNPLKD
jgi:DNA-binding XRE family transcriptional regulator